jgi:hypothetical protein
VGVYLCLARIDGAGRVNRRVVLPQGRPTLASTLTLREDHMPKATESTSEEPASERIDARIKELGDWRGETLKKVRALIKQAVPDVVEEWKWAKATSPGTPVWSHSGGICTGEAYKSVVKLTFFKGASLKDPKKLFNSSLEGNVRRAIDIREGEEIDAAAFQALIREAVAANESAGTRRT